jgi:hypothetical protein
VRRSLEWISGNLDRFTPLANGRLDESRLKAFSELALVYSYLHQWPHPALRDEAGAWSEFMKDWCTTPVIAQMPRKRRAVAIAYLLPYLMLRVTGYRCTYHEETLALLKRSKDLRPPELVPYRALELVHALWKSGFVREEPAWRRLAGATLLLKAGSHVGLDDEAAYAITHALFYLTDFGDRPVPLSARQLRRALDLVDDLLLHYWRTGHWDLVGELLTNLNCLDGHSTVIYAGASRAYEAVWGTDGTMPPKRRTQEPSASAAGREDIFGVRYHPTLVAVLYGATAMNAIRRNAGREGACTA